MATLKIGNIEVSFSNEIENISDRLLEKVEVETSEMKKYIRRQINISRWKRRSK